MKTTEYCTILQTPYIENLLKRRENLSDIFSNWPPHPFQTIARLDNFNVYMLSSWDVLTPFWNFSLIVRWMFKELLCGDITDNTKILNCKELSPYVWTKLPSTRCQGKHMSSNTSIIFSLHLAWLFLETMLVLVYI